MADIRDKTEQKRLKSHLESLKGEMDALGLEISMKQKELAQKKRTVEELRRKVEESNFGIPNVSEHALLRYLERVRNINLAEIENEILSESVLDLISKLGGSGKYPNNGYHVVMKEYTVVTIETKDK